MKLSKYMQALMICAIAAPAMAETPASLNFCTGGEGGFYEGLGTDIGKTIVKGSSIKLNVLNTGGSTLRMPNA
jgi:TRAP-type uncharacterized transport system substrate-binding protein